MANRDLNSFYNLSLYIARKERGILLTTTEFTQNLDSGQMERFEEDFKIYGLNQEIHDSLRPFRVYKPFASATDGSVVFPDDYQHLLASVFTVTGSTVNPVVFVEPDEFPDAITNQLRPVNLSNPIALDNSTGFNIFPQSQQTGAYQYLRRPAIPVYGYTQVGRTITYNPLTSVQCEFEDSYMNNILARSFKPLGINLDETAISQYAILQEKDTE